MALAEVHDFPEPDRFVGNVARNIRSLLAMRGIAAKELAQRVGMSDTTLSQRMGGHNRWLAIELYRVAQVFGVPADVLFAEDEDAFLEALRSRCSSDPAWSERHLSAVPDLPPDPEQGELF